MFIPRKGTPGRTVVEIFYKHGPMTFEQAIEVHKPFGMYLSRTREVYTRAVKSGWLTLDDKNVYALSPEMKAFFDKSPDEVQCSSMLTPARTPPEFRPLSSNNLPRLIPPRDDAPPLRDIYLLCGSARPEPLGDLRRRDSTQSTEESF